jgi:O-succinylbenzoic acid--CoA ligase
MADLVALDMPLGPLLVDEIRRAHDRGRAVCILDQRLSPERQSELLTELAPTHIVDAPGEMRPFEAGRDVESGDGLVVVSSGTSGAPKAAILTWSAVIASAEMTSSELFRGVRTVWNACLPPTHVGGFAVLARSIFSDDHVVFSDPHDVATANELGATHVAVVRTQWARHDLSQYRVVLLGGSRAPENLDSNVVTTWGMTETGSGVVYNGRALNGVDVMEVNGELWVHSPTLLRGYRNGDSPLVTGPDGRSGWLPTGDAGSIRNGEVTVWGRIDYVIVTGGEKLWPEDLEEHLARLDGVSDVAVLGVADHEWGQRVVAAVVSDRTTNELLLAFNDVGAERIGPWAKIKELHHVAAIPRTANGKIKRGELAEILQPMPPLG